MAFPPPEQILRTKFSTKSYCVCTPVTLANKQKTYTTHLATDFHSAGLCQIYVSSLHSQKGYSLRGVRAIQSSRTEITAGLIKKEEQMSM